MSSVTLGKPLFKQLRKGTRSCQECRRRKVRCIFARDTDIICELCQKFDRTCLKQEYHANQNLKTRIMRAKSVAERVPHTTDTVNLDNGNSASSDSDCSRAESQSPRATHGPKTSSFMKLFATTPVSGNQVNIYNRSDDGQLKNTPTSASTASLRTTVVFNDANLSDRAKLLSVLDHEPHALEVLDSASSWWSQWRDQGWARRTATSTYRLRDFVEVKLVEKDVVAVTMGLLCLAMSLFLFRPGIDGGTTALTSSSPAHLMEKILAVVDSLVLENDKFLNHQDIAVAILLRAKIHAEDSQASSAIRLIQKALNILQSTKFGQANRPHITADQLYSQQQLVGGVIEIDRYMCMVFGFPYIQDPHFSDDLALRVLLDESNDKTLRMRALRRVAAVTAGRIADRNAKQLSFDEMTNTTARRLDAAKSAMPAEWWNASTIATWDDSIAAFEVLITQMWFWTTTMFLFLPTILDPDNATKSNQSQCLSAARSLVQVFLALRQNPSISIQVCNCDDFMGVLAACVLLVAMLQEQNVTSTTFENDLYLIESLQDTFRYRALEQGGNIARQGLKVIDTLLSFFDHNSDGSSLETKSTTAVMLPYFGTIFVQVSKSKLASPSVTQFDTLPTPPYYDDSNIDIDESAFAGIDWDEWNQLMLDAELNQDWNVDLHVSDFSEA